MTGAHKRPTWWRPAWAMPGAFFCGWRVECYRHASNRASSVRRLSTASDLTQLRERAQ